MTGQELAATVERVRKAASVRVLELHTATCPAITTAGRRACRCGCAPITAMLEDLATAQLSAAVGADPGPAYSEFGDWP